MSHESNEGTPQESSEETLFDLFDRPSYETPDLLANRLGEQGIHDALSANVRKQEETRNNIDRLKREQESLRADQTALTQALILARDKGLE
ncbi:MAG TPA: hypothetical protein VGE13_03760 [Candidatus Saccharimonadales bacterium]